jgi:hypothetical protein
LMFFWLFDILIFVVLTLSPPIVPKSNNIKKLYSPRLRIAGLSSYFSLFSFVNKKFFI